MLSKIKSFFYTAKPYLPLSFFIVMLLVFFLTLFQLNQSRDIRSKASEITGRVFEQCESLKKYNFNEKDWCGGRTPFSKKYRFIQYACSDGSVHNLGGKTSCKNMAVWKQLAINNCRALLKCNKPSITPKPSISPEPTKVTPCIERPKCTYTEPRCYITEDTRWCPIPTITKPKISPTLSPIPTIINQYSIEQSPSSTINMGVSTPGTAYWVAAYLKESDKIVIDQTSMVYKWSINDPSIARILPQVACTNNIKSPCPEDHLSIYSYKKGTTTISIDIYLKSSGATTDTKIATATFTLNVN